MTTDNATPRPWKVAKTQAGIFYIRDSKDVIVSEAHSVLDGKNNEQKRKEQESNANLIVLAVNSYDALVEACIHAQKTIRELQSYAGVKNFSFPHHMSGHGSISALGCMDSLEEALKLAEAKP